MGGEDRQRPAFPLVRAQIPRVPPTRILSLDEITVFARNDGISYSNTHLLKSQQKNAENTGQI